MSKEYYNQWGRPRKATIMEILEERREIIKKRQALVSKILSKPKKK